MIVIVTGAEGSVGQALCPVLREAGWDVVGTDIGEMDVRDHERVRHLVAAFTPDVIVHLAGAKHAPEGELDPAGIAATNITGTANVLAGAAQFGARVVTASTCKACDPETAYGASKLIAERMTLNAGGSVARFYNVPESGGNVFRLWETLPQDAPIPVTDCRRYFITMDQAVALVIACLGLPAGRYTIDPGEPQWMRDVAARLYPGREIVMVPARRGDRRCEPLCAQAETFTLASGGLAQIRSPYDPPAITLAVAA